MFRGAVFFRTRCMLRSVNMFILNEYDDDDVIKCIKATVNWCTETMIIVIVVCVVVCIIVIVVVVTIIVLAYMRLKCR